MFALVEKIAFQVKICVNLQGIFADEREFLLFQNLFKFRDSLLYSTDLISHLYSIGT